MDYHEVSLSQIIKEKKQREKADKINSARIRANNKFKTKEITDKIQPLLDKYFKVVQKYFLDDLNALDYHNLARCYRDSTAAIIVFGSINIKILDEFLALDAQQYQKLNTKLYSHTPSCCGDHQTSSAAPLSRTESPLQTSTSYCRLFCIHF